MLLTSATGAGLEVPLRDGSVVGAESYTVTGSYVMITLVDGSRVAYDIADVDVEALRKAEAERDGRDGQEASPPLKARESLAGGRSLATADDSVGGGSSRLTISDGDVKHVRGSGVRGHEEQQEHDSRGDDSLPEGYHEGGRVMLNKVRVTPAGSGRWQIDGEVVNRDPEAVHDVSVKLETVAVGGGELWSGRVPVTSYLGPDETAQFSQSFTAEMAEGMQPPSVRATAVWTQKVKRRNRDYSQPGGADGAYVRPTPVQ
jgi:hypothetical protein